jgi:hypothetical protein
MGEAATILEPDEVVEPEAVEEPQEVPSVFSVTNRYLVGRVEVSPPAEDGSRVVRLHSGNGAAIIEANLSPQLCEFVSGKLVEVEVIEEAEVVEDVSASTSTD